MPGLVMGAVAPDRGAGQDGDEAGTDEVAALASLLSRGPHIPVPREDEDDESLEPTEDVVESHERVLPRQRDEFTCPRCFLVVHLSRRVGDVCRDCS